jgi:hypothetical protein
MMLNQTRVLFIFSRFFVVVVRRKVGFHLNCGDERTLVKHGYTYIGPFKKPSLYVWYGTKKREILFLQLKGTHQQVFLDGIR